MSEASLKYNETDRLMVVVLWWHAAILIIWGLIVYFLRPALYYPSPFSWHLLSASGLAFLSGIAVLAALGPTLLRGKLKIHAIFRGIVTIALSVMSFLVVFVSGASIEAHFHIFAVFALVTLYYDWHLPWLVLFLVILHRLTLNAVEPLLLYHYGRNELALFAHTFFTFLAALISVRIAQLGGMSITRISRANELLSSKTSQ